MEEQSKSHENMIMAMDKRDSTNKESKVDFEIRCQSIKDQLTEEFKAKI